MLNFLQLFMYIHYVTLSFANETSQTTLVQCHSIICPTLNCTNSYTIRLKGECCDKCAGEDLQVEPIIEDCDYGGFVYEHGSTFHPSADEPNVTNPYCSSCSCNNGTVECIDVTPSCPSLTSCQEEDAVYEEGKCCKVCPDVPLTVGECKDELGNIRQNEEYWVYYSSGYKQYIPCINCTCKNSVASCRKMPCPAVPQCTEENETNELVTLCCPTCTRNNGSSMTVAPPQNGSNMTDTPPPSTTGPTLVPCDSTDYTHKIYLCSGNSSVGIENTLTDTVQVYLWLPGGVKQVLNFTSDEFKTYPCNFIGRTIERRVNGLQNKESKQEKIRNCTKSCANLVVNMLRTKKISNQIC